MECSLFHSTILYMSLMLIASCQATPCSNDGSVYLNTTKCLLNIRKASEDKSRFWFGEKFVVNCEKKSKFSSDCFNPSARSRDSLVSRIFRRWSYDGDKVKSVLKVTYKTHTGSYRACGNTYGLYHSRIIVIDPLVDNQSLSPFELLSRPEIYWETRTQTNSTFHTLVLIDAGYVIVQALYINIPGNNLEGGQTIVEYEPPLNPTSNANPYVFLLFTQNRSIELSPQWLHELSLSNVERFENFLIKFDLDGPVGISWFTVRADPYSADRKRSPGHMNTCAQFVNQAFKKKRIAYLPRITSDLDVYLDITFESPAIRFSCCCNEYSYQTTIYHPNPIGDGEAQAALLRVDTKRRFVFRKSTAFPQRERDFKNELHTLIMVDPDSPFAIYGSSSKPYAHMVVVNIEEGEFETGQAVLPYSAPWPPDPDHHTYYFLLFKQPERFQPRFEEYAFLNCSGAFYGRCGFDVAAMIEDGGLELVGASWQLIKSTDYVRCVYVDLGVDEREVCAGVEGYTPKCVSDNHNRAPHQFVYGYNGFHFLVYIIVMHYCKISALI